VRQRAAKLFEFMAQGRPVLAPRTEPIESVVQDGRDALLFSPLDVKSFRDALRKLLASKELCDSIDAVPVQSSQEHTWEENARQILGNVS